MFTAFDPSPHSMIHSIITKVQLYSSKKHNCLFTIHGTDMSHSLKPLRLFLKLKTMRHNHKYTFLKAIQKKTSLLFFFQFHKQSISCLKPEFFFPKIRTYVPSKHWNEFCSKVEGIHWEVSSMDILCKQARIVFAEPAWYRNMKSVFIYSIILRLSLLFIDSIGTNSSS